LQELEQQLLPELQEVEQQLLPLSKELEQQLLPLSKELEQQLLPELQEVEQHLLPLSKDLEQQINFTFDTQLKTLLPFVNIIINTQNDSISILSLSPKAELLTNKFTESIFI
jgi:hypothetical protein